MAKFKVKDYPTLTDSLEDASIWNRGYSSVMELEQVSRDIGDGSEWYRFSVEDGPWIDECRAQCIARIDNGGLQRLTSTN
jgi:hypothetical protein